MQKSLAAFRVEIRYKKIPYQADLEFKYVVTRTWVRIQEDLKHGFASLQGGKDSFLQICKKS